MTNTHQYGKLGEQLAKTFLIGQGYRIIETNYRNRFGEIDLIGSDDGVTCFIEVKTRKKGEDNDPLDNVTPFKQKKIVRVASWYIMQNKLENQDLRFDVVAVYGFEGQEIKLIKNAFEA